MFNKREGKYFLMNEEIKLGDKADEIKEKKTELSYKWRIICSFVFYLTRL